MGADLDAAQRLRATPIELRKFCAPCRYRTVKSGQLSSGTLCAWDWHCYLRFGLADGSVGRGTVTKRCKKELYDEDEPIVCGGRRGCLLVFRGQ